MKVIRFNPFEKGTMRGFLTLGVDKWGISICDIAYHVKGDQRWLSLPSKAYEKDGATKYAPYIRFDTIELRDAFLAKALEVLDKHLSGMQAAPDDAPF